MSQPGKVNETEVSPPFILGEALPVVPTKLAKHILRGEYIDMAGLLKGQYRSREKEIGFNRRREQSLQRDT